MKRTAIGIMIFFIIIFQNGYSELSFKGKIAEREALENVNSLLSFKQKILKRRVDIALEKTGISWGDTITGNSPEISSLIGMVRRDLADVINTDNIHFRVTNDDSYFNNDPYIVAIHSYIDDLEYISIREEVNRVTHATLAHEIAHSLDTQYDFPICASYVTEYASKSYREDFAETLAVFRYGSVNMRVMSERDKCIKKKYDYMVNFFGQTFNTYLPMDAYSTASEGGGSIDSYR